MSALERVMFVLGFPEEFWLVPAFAVGGFVLVVASLVVFQAAIRSAYWVIEKLGLD